MKTLNHNASGYLSFLLHAHLPFIANPGKEPILEEKWLFEALTESYLPFFLSWERLLLEGIDFKLTLSISPTLLTMLTDPSLPERYGNYLDKLLELANREVLRTANDPQFAGVTLFYRQRLEEISHAYREKYQYDLVKPLKYFHQQGCIELITTCATHGFLPLMLTKEAQTAQVKIGVELFNDVFGFRPAGIWLPECAYSPGIEKILGEEGIKYFVVSSHGMLNASPQVSSAVYAPVNVGNNVAAFGRDLETSHQVWSRTEGYPGDYAYREFYRDIGYDLDYDYIASYLVAGIRGDTGLKYYRITGKDDRKEPYDYHQARAKAREHAENFVFNRNIQVMHWKKQIKQKPIVVAPYDAELFGHWWFEGPDWLEEVCRLTAKSDSPTKLTTFSAYLGEFPPQQEVRMTYSTWGDGGFNRVWLNESNDWIYPHLHRAEKAMVTMADNYCQPSQLQIKALNQAVRELLLAQSSDWPFIINGNTTVDYAKRRFHEHLDNFFNICHQFQNNLLDDHFLTELENVHPIFPKVDYRVYQSINNRLMQLSSFMSFHKPVVLMLSWEYPPNHVGGLGIHVRNLSEVLAKEFSVHVLTFTQDEPGFSEIKNGVAVHYLSTMQKPSEIDFLSWVLQLNIAMAEFGQEIIRRCRGENVLIHAHDWLVSYAAREIKNTFEVPLISTIHATESGRNQGRIYNQMQQSIHQLEQELIDCSNHIICCSRFMENEIKKLFRTSTQQLSIIPNAVNPIRIAQVQEKNESIVFFGRLVIEKGVQHLIMAFSRLVPLFPETKLVIAGNGPYAEELKDLVHRLQLEEKVHFSGFISEKQRNRLLGQSRVAVFPSIYEPFGIVALEAMSAGVPVIVSRTGGFAETVEDGVTGLLFNPEDVDGLVSCLIRIFQDPVSAMKLSKMARLKVDQDYTWEAVARETACYYRNLTEKTICKEDIENIS